MKATPKNYKVRSRLKKKISIRKKISGSHDRPRLSVYKSNKYLYAQVIDDDTSQTLVSASTKSLAQSTQDRTTKLALAQKLGHLLAQKCIEKDIKKVVFDRNGYIYHGRVQAIAEAARSNGLEF